MTGWKQVQMIVLVAAAWWAVALWSGNRLQAQSASGSRLFGQKESHRTTLVDGRPLMNRPAPRQNKAGGVFSWLEEQRRRLVDATRNFFSPTKPARRMRRPGRMKFPYLGNRPATKKKPSTSFWSRWWPFGRQRK